MKIGFLGGGNMASALIGGIRQADPEARIEVVDPHPPALQALATKFGCVGHASLATLPSDCDMLVLAVKPQNLHEVCAALAGRLGQPTVVSVAAGIRARDIARWLGGWQRIVRTMPNTPALIGRGITALAALPQATDSDRNRAQALMQAVGTTVWVDDENQLDAVTATSGSGPAYVFYLIEAMTEAAQALGLPAATARQLVIETVAGAAELARQSDEDAATLRARVTSKGGTTAAAIAAFDDGELKALVGRALLAANNRSIELGDQLGQADQA